MIIRDHQYISYYLINHNRRQRRRIKRRYKIDSRNMSSQSSSENKFETTRYHESADNVIV